MRAVIVSWKEHERLFRYKYKHKLYVIILFFVLFFVIASSCYHPYILTASILCHLILITFVSWVSRLLAYQKVMYQSSERATVTGGKNEYY